MLALLLILLGIYILYKISSSFWITIPRFIWDPTPQGRRNRANRATNFYLQHHGPQIGTDSQNTSSHYPSQDDLNSYSDRCDYGNSSYDSSSSICYDSSSSSSHGSSYDSGSSSSYDSGSSSSYDSGSSSSYDSGSSSSDSW
jgi:hypothetical protein